MKKASMLSAGFDPVVPAIKQPQTKALDRTATYIGSYVIYISLSKSTLTRYFF
jgi:hypothetical protein